MMEDEKVAKSFLSAIIGEEVLELDFSTQEHTVYKPVKDANKEKEEKKELFLTVCRFDFSAKISLPGGKFKTVAVELQKAKMPSDIMRFRRYLGLHYKNSDNTYDGDDGEKKARQIYCIFLLGYDIGFPGHPVLQSDSQVKDVTTREYLSASGNEFVESLHHRSWIVQIDQLKQRRRNDIEKLLSIFDQDNRTQDHHIMNVNENDFPEIYRPIIRRLRMACLDEQIQIEMEMEDDYLKELQDRDRSLAAKDKTIEEQDKVIEEQGKELEEKDKTIEEDKKVIAEQNKELEELRKQLAKFKNDNN
jgi:hypothetical protein